MTNFFLGFGLGHGPQLEHLVQVQQQQQQQQHLVQDGELHWGGASDLGPGLELDLELGVGPGGARALGPGVGAGGPDQSQGTASTWN